MFNNNLVQNVEHVINFFKYFFFVSINNEMRSKHSKSVENDEQNNIEQNGEFFQLIDEISNYFSENDFSSIIQPLNHLNLLISTMDKKLINFSNHPILETFEKLLINLLKEEITDQEINNERDYLINDGIFIFLQLVIQNEDFSNQMIQSNFLLSLINFLETLNERTFKNILKILSIFSYNIKEHFEYLIENEIPQSILIYFHALIEEGNYEKSKQKLENIDFFDVFINKNIEDIDNSIIIELYCGIIELHSNILLKFERNLQNIQEIIVQIALTESKLIININEPLYFIELITSNGIINKLNSFINFPAFANCWYSIIKLNTNCKDSFIVDSFATIPLRI